MMLLVGGMVSRGLWPPLLFSTFLGNVITMLLANRAVQYIKVSEVELHLCCLYARAHMVLLNCSVQVSLIVASAEALV